MTPKLKTIVDKFSLKFYTRNKREQTDYGCEDAIREACEEYTKELRQQLAEALKGKV
jgi:hypothetical protein